MADCTVTKHPEHGYSIVTLPPGFHLRPGRCPTCGGRRSEVDRLEGLPVYACDKNCGMAKGRRGKSAKGRDA
jgi:hypothetical protein